MVIVNPDPQALAEYQLRQHQWELERREAEAAARHAAPRRSTACAVELHANIELPEDVARRSENGATGIGLFRTEFLFLNRDNLPDEDEQFEAYRGSCGKWTGCRSRSAPTTSAPTSTSTARELRPRPTRRWACARSGFCLAEPQMFLTQLRAILRASHYGKVQILIPMLLERAGDRRRRCV